MSLSNIIKQWKNIKVEKRISPPKTRQLKGFIKNNRDSMEAKVALSPYARILASPLRRCSYHRKIFPSKLLLRFGTGWHTETNTLWAFPTLTGKFPGRGYYVNLQKKVLEILKHGQYNTVFYGTAKYRTDMTEHVQDLLIQESFRQFNSFSLKSFHRLKPLKDTEWTTENPLVNDYQCIILLDQQHTGDMCQLNHSIRSQTGVQSSIPCYNVKHVWSEEQINQILSKLGTDKIALGVSKSLKTVDLAIALWRCRKFAV